MNTDVVLVTPEMAAIFDAMEEGILIIDADARIVFGNKIYCNFLKKSLSEITGEKLRDVRPGAMLPNVLHTGKPVLHAPRQEMEEIYFVNMYPIFIDGVLRGGISVVTFIQQAFDFQVVIAEIEQRSKRVMRRIAKASNAKYTFDDVISVAPVSLETKALAERAAKTEASVFLQSESGTGKELYAQAIHNASARNGSIFLALNCANFNPNTLESELFGYAEGAFTGAKKGGKIGLFEAASGGTLFLDEISEIELPLQAKLLRALQERRIRPVGGIEERDVDVRIIAACNADILRYVEEGRFRADLYYRLNAFPIHIPPLRDRLEDIDPLVALILEEFSKKMKRSITITREALRLLRFYDWPGNVRELRNVVEFTAYLSENGVIHEDILPEGIIKHLDHTDTTTLSQRVKRFERQEIQRLLRLNGKDLAGKKKTAAQLGISLATLYNKISG